MSEKKKKAEPGYLGGLASMGATCLTHPLDTIKVQLQTQKKVKHGFFGMAMKIIKTTGFFSLYNGMSAALLRQATYSTTRFAFYEWAKEILVEIETKKGLGGGIGSIVGSPADLINVRMQNDSKLPLEKRRNYKNCFEALYRITKTEGFTTLYTGFHMSAVRGVLVTVGQLAFYDEIKTRLIKTTYFNDTISTHFLASMCAGFIATLITMPADVIKTLLMNAKPGELNGILHTSREVLKHDKLGLFKGFWPPLLVLQRTDEEKDLGVYITSGLKWRKHCTIAASKANKALGQIRNSFCYLERNTFKLLYNALVRSHLEYAVSVWCPTLKGDLS
ncbi:unnamed protein product [Brachionus calyciflorus]|uniref:Uncharacterized protein n=1 Tax=Brachionus calyciflorus TaxID=104777 RepID=A0A813WAS9_9BILA|nr:unnamed protein product [Brachionus calyciflorus]